MVAQVQVGSLFAFSFNLRNPTAGQDAPPISLSIFYGQQVALPAVQRMGVVTVRRQEMNSVGRQGCC